MFRDIQFANPEFLWGLLLVPLILVWHFYFHKRQTATLTISSISGFKGVSSIKNKFRWIVQALPILAIISLFFALARPQTVSMSTKTTSTKGIDIVMAIDVSSSMLAKDLKPNRLRALKKEASAFIKARVTDRIGLVVYAGESFTKTPITSDKSVVLRALEQTSYGDLEDGTAIGMGLATSVNRLKDSKAKSKIIILLTDGVNNAGFIEPTTATELALSYGIKIYTIALGTKGKALAPVAYNVDGSFRYGYSDVKIDEQLLKEIAKKSGGAYFRATDNNTLERIYKQIDALEKTDIEELTYYHYQEKYRVFVFLAALCLLLTVFLKATVFKGIV